MGPGGYVGRIGALAVALGIGVAVFTGQGTASASPTEGSDTESSSESSSPDTATESASDAESAADPADPEASSDDDAAEDDTASQLRRSNKRWQRAQESQESTSRLADRDDGESTDDTERTTTDTAPTTTDVDEADIVEASPPEPSAIVEETTITEPAETTKPKPSDPVTVEFSGLVNALVSPFAGQDDEPTAPIDSPAVWTLAAAARRELQPVVAIPQTAPLEALQRLPIIGPLAITPIVAVLHQIPIVSDVLHPFIGYPLQPGGAAAPRDVKVVSFDGTEIYVHFMPATGLLPGQKAPTVLNGPGLGMPGATNIDGTIFGDLLTDAVGMIGVETLRDAGYNVVTWDPRGEWQSGGQLEIDSPDFEGRDVQAIITWVAQQPEAAFDPGSEVDPLIGMVGASYGGGIQLVTAAIDDRVDAIVPTIAWHSLNTALYKDEAFKTSWGALLSGVLLLTGADVNPRLYPAAITGILTGEVSEDDQQLLDDRGPGELVEKITAPTLLIQGTVDTLFTLQEAHDNATILIENGVPTKVVWFCGGHGGCVTSSNDGEVLEQATLAWLDKYVKGLDVPTGPQFEWVDQHGDRFSSDTYPVEQGAPLSVTSAAGGTLPLRQFFGGSGPNLRALTALPLGALGVLSAAEASNAVELTTAKAATTTYVVGAPELTLTYSGTGTSRHVYAQLVDDATGLVLGNHVTPIPVTLDGGEHTITIPLEMIAHTLAPGQTLTLQLVASAVTYQALRSSGELTVSSMTLSLPTADAAVINLPSDSETANVA